MTPIYFKLTLLDVCTVYVVFFFEVLFGGFFGNESICKIRVNESSERGAEKYHARYPRKKCRCLIDLSFLAECRVTGTNCSIFLTGEGYTKHSNHEDLASMCLSEAFIATVTAVCSQQCKL